MSSDVFDDMSLEDLLSVEIVTASKKAESLSDAPGVVTVITAGEIRAFGATNLMDALQRVPGLQPISSHLFVQNVASMRGDLMTHTDNHVLILLDGRPVREGLLGGTNSPVYTGFPIDMIERVEVIRGPGSVLYGTNAFTGVVNIITKKLITGAQLNKPDHGDVDVVPRAGLIYYLTDQVGLKALHSQAFRSPAPNEFMIQIPVLHGNPNLGPEKIATTDLQLFFTNGQAETALTYFRSRYSDMIARIACAGGGQTFVNQDELNISGIEFEAKTSLGAHFFLTGSATYQTNKEEKTPLPHTTIKIGSIYRSDFGLTAGIFNSYFGKPHATKGAEINPDADAVNLLSINVRYQLPVSWPVEIAVCAQNVLDSDYYFPEFSKGMVNTLPMGSGRTICGSLTVKL